MGGGYSTYSSGQEHEWAKERERKRAIKEAKKREREAEKNARKAEKDAWLKSRQGEVKKSSSGWFLAEWVKNALVRPLEWWRERKAWEREEARGEIRGPPDNEWIRSPTGEPPQQPQGESTQGSWKVDLERSGVDQSVKRRKY